MGKRLVIALGYGSLDDRNAITEYLRAKEGWGWWHHLPDLWLVIASDHTANVPEIAENIKSKLSVSAHILVFDVDDMHKHSGWLAKDAWHWITTQWVPPNSGYSSFWNP